MAKVEINNEIVLLRHVVRQARVRVISKLTRDSKALRNKHGNEEQQKKYKRKADKLIAEVCALKTIKDDDITKFGIMNEREISDILQDQSLNNSDHVIAKVANNKSLHRRLVQFKEKFPDCKKYLTSKKKKTTKLKDKSTGQGKKSSKENSSCIQNKNSKKQRVSPDKNIENPQQNSEEISKAKLPNMRDKLCKRERLSDRSTLDSKKLMKLEENSELGDTVIDKQLSIIKPCSVTKEGTVKRLAELIEEQESSGNEQRSAESTDFVRIATVQPKIADNFFLTGNDQEDYRDDSISTSTSYANSWEYNTRPKIFKSANRVKMPSKNTSVKHNNYTNFNKTQKYSQLKKKPKGKNTNQDKKYLGKQATTTRQERRASMKMNKGANKSNLNANDKTENASLHPSWLAKKKQQEIMKQGFQGKKILFTDD